MSVQHRLEFYKFYEMKKEVRNKEVADINILL